MKTQFGRCLLRAQPACLRAAHRQATLTPAIAQRAREATTCFFSRCRSRKALMLPVLSLGVCLSGSAATRICSVYVESVSALQKQLYLGAEAFQAPALGALPMMITAGLPGAAQIDNGKPVALHVLDIGDGETGLVVEVIPSGSPDAYLQALAGAGTALPEAVDGVYTLANGTAAKVVGNRLLFVPKAGNPSACLGPDVERLPGMPAIPGVIRISVSPAALAPMLEKLKKTMAAGGGRNVEQGRRSLESAVDFYSQILAQIDTLHLGINIQTEGLFIRSRLAPNPGSDLAALMASGKPVSATQLAFIEKGSLVSYATGGCIVPERLKRQFVDLYAQLSAMSPLYGASQTNDLVAVMNHSIRMFGAPMAFTGGLPADGAALQIQGTISVPDPAQYLKDQIALMKSPAFQKLMGQSGMKFPEPTTRMCKGLTVYAWKTQYDEDAMELAARAALPPGMPPEQAEAVLQSSMASMRLVVKLFGNGYEYAAMSKDVVYGMGSSKMIESAIDRVQAPAGVSAEAERIEALLAPSGAPQSLGRFSLSGLMNLALSTQPELAAAMKGVPAGEGVVFAGWAFKDERLTAHLIPASDIKAIMAVVQAVQDQAMQKRQGGPPPVRPPIPPNF